MLIAIMLKAVNWRKPTAMILCMCRIWMKYFELRTLTRTPVKINMLNTIYMVWRENREKVLQLKDCHKVLFMELSGQRLSRRVHEDIASVVDCPKNEEQPEVDSKVVLEFFALWDDF